MERNTIFLIHPTSKVLGKKDNLFTNESLTPSLGLAMIGAYCDKNGINSKVIDLRLPHYQPKQIINEIERINPLFVGITAFTNEIIQAGAIAKIIKKVYPHLIVVIGGPHCSAIPKETLEEFQDFDIAVIGEGEETTLDIARILKYKCFDDLKDIPGIAIRIDDEIKLNFRRKPIKNIDGLPFPAWDFFEMNFYNKVFMVSASRGCPYKCYFCNPNYLGNDLRIRSPLNIVDEIEWIVKKFGAKKIQFADATLSLLGEKTSIMCEELIRRGLHRIIEWDCETRADAINKELLNKMKQAGCRWIALGVETGNEIILKEVVRKNETKDQIRQAVKMVKSIGLKIRCFFILGHFKETVKTIKETIKFAIELNPDALSFGLMVPNPGSEIRKIGKNETSGVKILNNEWNNYNQFNYNCFETNDLSLPELKKWRSNAYFSFYTQHPIKALGLFFNKSGYNYNFKTLIKVLPEFMKDKFKR